MRLALFLDRAEHLAGAERVTRLRGALGQHSAGGRGHVESRTRDQQFRVAELLLPGAVFDVPAPATGVLAERTAQPGEALS
jgi:hypothetical protein